MGSPHRIDPERARYATMRYATRVGRTLDRWPSRVKGDPATRTVHQAMRCDTSAMSHLHAIPNGTGEKMEGISKHHLIRRSMKASARRIVLARGSKAACHLQGSRSTKPAPCDIKNGGRHSGPYRLSLAKLQNPTKSLPVARCGPRRERRIATRARDRLKRRKTSKTDCHVTAM